MKNTIAVQLKTKKRFDKFRAIVSGKFGVVLTQDDTLQLLLGMAEAKVKKK